VRSPSVRVRAIGWPSLLCAVTISCSCGHVSDRSLRKRFDSHEADFHALRGMFISDAGIMAITKKGIRTATVIVSPRDGLERVGLSPARYAQYIRLLEALGLEGGIVRGDNSTIWFGAETPSILNGDSTKGYVYSNAELTPCVTDLNSYKPGPAALNQHGGFVVFSLIKPHWYLYRQAG